MNLALALLFFNTTPRFPLPPLVSEVKGNSWIGNDVMIGTFSPSYEHIFRKGVCLGWKTRAYDGLFLFFV